MADLADVIQDATPPTTATLPLAPDRDRGGAVPSEGNASTALDNVQIRGSSTARLQALVATSKPTASRDPDEPVERSLLRLRAAVGEAPAPAYAERTQTAALPCLQT